jgi:hypothetical protein
MKFKATYSLCEAIADITQITTQHDFWLPNSRDRIELYIKWAEEFEWLHRDVEWGLNSPCEYIDAIEFFTIFRLKCYRDHDSRAAALGER